MSSSAQRKPILKLHAKMSDDTALRTARPLFPPTIWSPSTAWDSKSAGLPPKPTWTSLVSPVGAGSTPFSGSHNNLRPFPGLGVTAEDGAVFEGNTKHRLDFKAPTSTIRFTQTKEYHNPSHLDGAVHNLENHNSGNSWALVVKTDPLPQHQFADAQHPKDGTYYVHPSAFADSPPLTGSSAPIPAICISPAVDLPVCHAGQLSSPSATPTSFYLEHGDGDAVSKTSTHDVWMERQHNHSLRRALKDPSAQWEQAFDGALNLLAGLNPQHYKMVAGSVVINIKTEFVDNLVASVKASRYSCMDKVSERIMEVYNSRSPTQKLLFMFSVIGGKKFSGLAEMSGPWDPSHFLSDWLLNPACPPCTGSFPVTWIYVKDVWYNTFDRIRQPSNDHPVSNMWNGMRFPDETGRDVVRGFVQTPATASILGYPRNYLENFQRRDGSEYGQPRGAPSARGLRGGWRGGSRGGKNNNSWRENEQLERNGAVLKPQDNDATPAVAKPRGLDCYAQVPPRCNFPVTGAVQPGDVDMASLNENSDIISTNTTNMARAQASLSLAGRGAHNNAMVRSSQPVVQPPLDNCARHESVRLAQHSDAAGIRSGVTTFLPSPAFSRPHGITQSHSHPPAALQHSVSMSALRTQPTVQSKDARVLLASGSMNSLPITLSDVPEHRQHTAHRTGSGTHRQLQQNHNGSFPFRETPTCGVPPGHLQEQDTPTHHPNAPTTRHTAMHFAIDANANQHRLMARYHSLQAAGYNLQHELRHPNAHSLDRRLVEARLAQNTAEIRVVELELGISSSPSESLSPERYDSFKYEDGSSNSSESAPNLSPLPADDARTPGFLSTVGTPNHIAGSDLEPGLHGDSGISGKHYDRDAQSRWDSRLKNVDDFLSSLQNVGKGSAVQTPNQTSSSSYIANNTADGGQLPRSTSNFSFTGPAKVNRQEEEEQHGGVRLDT